jgi:F-type H+-transporting ATPase subunit delta
MQEKLTIARPYAHAAYSYAAESNDVPEWSAMLNALAEAVVHPDLQPLISDPRVSEEQLESLLDDVLAQLLNEKRKNFIATLVDAERLELAPEIAELFERKKAAAAGVIEVNVESAFEMTGPEQDRLASAVRARLGKDCELSTAVNSDLIGGAVIRVGDSVIDISLKGRLRALQQRLT